MRHLVGALLVPAVVIGVVVAASPARAQDKALPTPPNLTLDNVPPIPQSTADGLAKYSQFRQAQFIGWNPAKRQMLITTALGSTTQLYYVDGPGRDRHQLTWYDRSLPVISSASFDSADPNSFIFQFDPGGSELRSLYRYDMTTGDATLVMPSKTWYSHVWSRQGKWLVYDSTERNGKDRDLYVVQPSDPSTKRKLADVEGSFMPLDWSPDGATILASEVVSNLETYLWRIDVKTGAKTAITQRADGKVSWWNARFSNDGRRIFALSDRQGGTWRLWRCDVAKGVWSAVTPDDIRLDTPWAAQGATAGFEISPDGTVIAALADRGTYSDLLLIDTTTLKVRSVALPARGTVTQLMWRPGSRELGFSLGSLKSQGDVYSVDASLGTVTRWTTSEASFNPDVLPAPEVVEWKSFDGTVISGVLYKPAARFTGPRPVMINIHGGPDAIVERVRWQGRSNYLLNELGMAVLFPNVRGSAGFGRAFAQMDDGKGREGAIKDIGAALDWIVARPDLDQSRVVLTGASYGGWLALEAGIYYNSRIRAIIEGAGQTDLVTYLENTEAGRQENRRAEFGDERDPQMRAFLTSISPVTRAKDLKTPTFILHPGKDVRVPVTQAHQLVEALKANNATVWYAEFTEATHDGFPGTQTNYNWMLAAWMTFLKAYVLN